MLNDLRRFFARHRRFILFAQKCFQFFQRLCFAMLRYRLILDDGLKIHKYLEYGLPEFKDVFLILLKMF